MAWKTNFTFPNGVLGNHIVLLSWTVQRAVQTPRGIIVQTMARFGIYTSEAKRGENIGNTVSFMDVVLEGMAPDSDVTQDWIYLETMKLHDAETAKRVEIQTEIDRHETILAAPANAAKPEVIAAHTKGKAEQLEALQGQKSFAILDDAEDA